MKEYTYQIVITIPKEFKIVKKKVENQEKLTEKEKKVADELVLSELENKELPDGQDLFEEIQNKYNLYDNCVLDFDKDDNPDNIIIESIDKKMLQRFKRTLQTKYNLKDKTIHFQKVDKQDSIIDEGRDEETGGFPV